jgi:hypothetical protein
VDKNSIHSDEGAEPPTSPKRVPVSAAVAAKHLGWDVRKVRKAIARGELGGFSVKHAQRRSWYVYADALGPQSPSEPPPQAERGSARQDVESDLRAENVALKEANLLLLAGNARLQAAITELNAAATNFQDAVSLFMTPGHPGGLD